MGDCCSGNCDESAGEDMGTCEDASTVSKVKNHRRRRVMNRGRIPSFVKFWRNFVNAQVSVSDTLRSTIFE